MKREKICSYVLVLAVALASVCPTQANAGEGAAKAVSWQAAGAASVRVVTVNAGKIKNLAVNSGSSVKLKLAGVKGSGKTTWSVSDGCTRLKKKYRKSATIKAVSFGTAIITAKNGKNTWKARVCVQEETKDIESFSESLVSLITSRSGGDGSRGSSGIAVADAEFFSARLLVKSTKKNAQFAAYAPTAVLKGEDGVFVLQFATASRAKKALAKIKKRKDVVWAEPDMLVGGGADQADSELPACDTRETEDRIDQADSELPVCDTIESVGDAENKTAGLASYSLSWGVERMGADVLAPTLSGSVTVAVIDTGVSAHQFLSGLLVQGYDFVSGDADPSDEHFHGTHVAGTVADVAAGHVKIMPLRVLDASGYGYTSTIGLALRYAADHGAGVANLSLSGGHSDYVDQSATYAIAKGVTVVAAAGNDNSDTAYYCPAHIGNAIVVSAIDSNEDRAYFSNHGNSVDLAAPGVGIYSCVPGGYETLDGTSMAAPHIAGAAALLKLKYPTDTPAMTEKRLKACARDLGNAGWDRYYGYGIPDLALYAEDNPPEIEPEDPVVTPDPGITPTPDPWATPTPDPWATPPPDPWATPTPDPWATPTPDPWATPTPDPWATPTPDPWAEPAPGETITDPSGYVYRIVSGNAQIVGYKGSETALIVPTQLGGRMVTSVADGAFTGGTGIVSVRINGTVSLGVRAFAGCTGLVQVDIYGMVGSAASKTFDGCRNLRRFYVYGMMNAVSADAFSGCSSFAEAGVYGIVDRSLIAAFESAPSVPTVTVSGIVSW